MKIKHPFTGYELETDDFVRGDGVFNMDGRLNRCCYACPMCGIGITGPMQGKNIMIHPHCYDELHNVKAP